MSKPFILGKFNLLVVEIEGKVEGFELSLLKNVRHNLSDPTEGYLVNKVEILRKRFPGWAQLYKGGITLSNG